MKSKHNIRTISFLLISILLPLIMGAKGFFSQEDAIFIFFVTFFIDLIYLYPKIKQLGMGFLFSPCVLSVIYISFNSIVGGIFMKNDWCLDYGVLTTFHSISSDVLFKYTFLTIVFNAFLCTIAYTKSKRVVFLSINNGSKIKKDKMTVHRVHSIVILSVVLSLLATIPALTYHSERTTTNAILSLYFPIYLSVLASIFYNVLRCGFSTKMVLAVMLGLFVMSAVALFHSKREAFFCLLLMIMMYSFDKKTISLKLRHILIGGLVGVLSVVLVLASSLMRGYNNFEGDSFIEAVKAIPQYAASPTFMSAIGGNFEVVSAYPHTVNAFNYIDNGKIPTLYGETFWRVLFVPIPESLFGYKPRKMLDIYTLSYDSSFRDIGGSYPVMCYAEFYANFKYLAIVFLLLFFYFFEKFYYNTWIYWGKGKDVSKEITLICIFATFIMFTRGAGFSSYCIYIFLYWITNRIIRKVNLV